MKIDSLSGIQNPAIEGLAKQAAPGKVAAGKGEDFAHMLMDVLKEVNESQNKSTALQNDFMTGRQSVDIHDLKIAMERAGITLNLTLAVRNKLLEAYQEINRMQV